MAEKYILEIHKGIEWEVRHPVRGQFQPKRKFIGVGIHPKGIDGWRDDFTEAELKEPLEIDVYLDEQPILDHASMKPIEHLSTTINGLLDYLLDNQERFGFGRKK